MRSVSFNWATICIFRQTGAFRSKSISTRSAFGSVSGNRTDMSRTLLRIEIRPAILYLFGEKTSTDSLAFLGLFRIFVVGEQA